MITQKLTSPTIEEALSVISPIVKQQQAQYYLKNKDKIAERQAREEEEHKKLSHSEKMELIDKKYGR